VNELVFCVLCFCGVFHPFVLPLPSVVLYILDWNRLSLVMALPPVEPGALNDRLNVVVNIDELNLAVGLDKSVPLNMIAKVEAVAPPAVQVGNVIAAIATDAAGERFNF
jgi:hypothetical protein